MKPKVIFIDSVHPILYERLESVGYECHWKYDLNREEILPILEHYEGAVIRSKFRFDSEVFSKAKQLKWVARSGAGMENIDHKAAAQHKVTLFNSPEGNRDAVAEHCLGMLLSLFNHFKRSDREVRESAWNREKNRGMELKGKTVGILGYGFMGEAFAQRLQGLGVTTLAYDKYKSGFESELVQEVSLEQLQEETDVLSIHLPLTEETHYMVDEAFLQAFQKNIYLINTARGNNVKTEALVAALESGKVLGACLDVLEYEKSSFEALNKANIPSALQYLRSSDRVLLTPHVAGWTVESYFKLSNVLADKIIKWRAQSQ